MEQALEFCAARVREADKDRFLATLFAPERYRGPLLALYAFDVEIGEVRDRITQPLPGEVRLQWWRDILTATEPGDAAANPVAVGLKETISRYALPVPELLDLIDAHTFDLYDEPMATVAALENYAVATSATMIRFAAQVLNDGAEPGHEAIFRHAGIARAIAAILQRLPLYLSRGQRFLPDEVLMRHGAAAADLQVGQITPGLHASLAELRQIVRQHLAALKNSSNAVPSRLLPALLPTALLPAALDRIERSDPLRPSVLPQWRRQWILWRAARKPARFIAVKPDTRG